MISRIVRQNAGSLTPGRKFIMLVERQANTKVLNGWDECPAPNQLRNSGRVGAADTLSDNLEIKTPGPQVRQYYASAITFERYQ